MLIRIGYELAFEVPRPTSMQLMLYVHPDQAAALRRPEKIVVEPDVHARGSVRQRWSQQRCEGRDEVELRQTFHGQSPL